MPHSRVTSLRLKEAIHRPTALWAIQGSKAVRVPLVVAVNRRGEATSLLVAEGERAVRVAAVVAELAAVAAEPAAAAVVVQAPAVRPQALLEELAAAEAWVAKGDVAERAVRVGWVAAVGAPLNSSPTARLKYRVVSSLLAQTEIGVSQENLGKRIIPEGAMARAARVVKPTGPGTVRMVEKDRMEPMEAAEETAVSVVGVVVALAER